MRLLTPDTLPPTNGYSHVAVVPPHHRLVWTAGQVPMDADGRLVGAGDWETQTRQVFTNVSEALRAGGASWREVFKLTIYVADTSALAIVRTVRDEFIDVRNPPTSSLVAVAGLFRPDVLIEIEAVAAVPD
ncbi:RidA family protein [Nocardia pseudobrasiliensis]|uniref:Enamine deaminase RidA (YjgF/YER057c/UK114 family) n=1 Tax=Nocardia pseudobrasiliensis TaxID=45979 RepID=A0A370I012_9NOCA|nr:RidA family protein [Nocardia pseudobrasiliensis]RDI64096.1 enamine deaminase RidA (YjgF/YER057c/UK114 family) [Nocardia pseudobrasiliensis]